MFDYKRDYKRLEINADVFKDMMPLNAKLYRTFDLPMIEFKANGITYKATDMRPLNETAVYMFEKILNCVINNPNCDEVVFTVDGDVSDDSVELVIDILMGMKYSAKKNGKNGFETHSAFLIGGFERKQMAGSKDLDIIVKLIEDHANAIYDYAQKNKTDKYNYLELVMAVANESENRMREWALKEMVEG